MTKMIRKIEKSFSISLPEMRRIAKDFCSEMERGLAGKESSLKMLPTYVHRPSGNEKGSCIALDLGGTNFRILEVTLKGGGKTSAPKVMKFALKKGHITGSGEKLFDFLAGCLKTFLKKNKMYQEKERRLGFTFSFPVLQTGIASGSLVCWTKGFKARGVVGKDVVKLLEEALARQHLPSIKVAALANDTVGTLVAGSYEDRACDIGVIIGTGTNACYPEKISNIAGLKLSDRHCEGAKRPKQSLLDCFVGLRPPRNDGEMIINIEWGNFNKLKRNAYDEELDRNSANPGEQALEKMVSGMYLGEVARLVLADMAGNGARFRGLKMGRFAKPYGFKTEEMSDLAANKSTDRSLRFVLEAVSSRASRIAASCLAAIITRIDPNLSRKHTIAIDGSVYEKYPDFSRNVKAALKEILGNNNRRIKIALAKDGSGKGAAIIAAIV